MPVVCSSDAITFFDRLPSRLKAPSLHPAYVSSDATRSDSLHPMFVVEQRGGVLYYHAFQTETIPGINLIDVQSPYGYGGPIATTTDPEFLAVAWAKYDEWCQENKVVVEFMRFHPLLDNWRYFAGDVMYDRDTVYIDLTRSDLFRGYAPRSRTAIRKAIANNVQVEWTSTEVFLDAFHPLYASTMCTLGTDHSYYFPPRYFENIVDSNMVWLGVCRKETKIISGAIFLVGEHLVEYHLSASSMSGKTVAATNLLVHRAAIRAQSAGKAMLHLGGGANSSEDNRLLFFKRGFSRRTASFRIGRKVHQSLIYENLKADWELKHGEPAKKILFYKNH